MLFTQWWWWCTKQFLGDIQDTCSHSTIYCISLASYVGLYYIVDKYKYACVSLLDNFALAAHQSADGVGRATGRQTGRPGSHHSIASRSQQTKPKDRGILKKSAMASLLSLRPEVEALREKLTIFVEEECIPAEEEYEEHMKGRSGPERWTTEAIPPVIERLKVRARKLGFWNLFLPHPLPATVSSPSREPTMYLSNREYGILCEIMGRSTLAPEACNCNAPDTGNMEVLLKHGNTDQQRTWLGPLLDGNIRSAFLMTEPDVASSDATNIETRLTKIRDADGAKKGVRYVLNGRKWWSTGAMDPRCKFALVLAKMESGERGCKSGGKSGADSTHGAHTVVLVPMNTPGVRLERALTVFGYDDAPHGHAEVSLTNVEVDASALILGEGRGFEIAQSRLGPGRIHHCMRAVGLAARCYELMLQRSLSRKTFGKYLAEHGSCQEMIAGSAADLEAARLLTLSCAAE